MRLAERAAPGSEFRVSTRVSLTGELAVPVGDGKATKQVAMTGSSTIDYDERVLPADGKTADQKTFRVYRKIDFARTVADQRQEMTLRPEVRRLVVMRLKGAKVPFSPDGPLTWGEIDLLRTDIFTPALAGLLPERAVRPRDRWKASAAAVRELTDMEVKEGGLECTFQAVTEHGGRKVAWVTFAGELSGVNEDGPNKQTLKGTLYFDLESHHISYVSLHGTHELLDAAGKTAGTVKGQFVLIRQANVRSADLADAALRNLTLEPNADNTLLLYDNPDLGVRLLHPRRWRIGRVTGRQLTIDETNGSGLLLTLEPPDRIPTAFDYLRESTAFLTKQKAQILAREAPSRLANAPKELDRFWIEAKEMNGQRVIMHYFVAKQANGGATLAARLLPEDREALQREVERIARSLTVTRKLENSGR